MAIHVYLVTVSCLVPTKIEKMVDRSSSSKSKVSPNVTFLLVPTCSSALQLTRIFRVQSRPLVVVESGALARAAPYASDLL